MSINQRQAKLLKILLDQAGYIPTVDVSDALACSERTIRNDMRAANAFLDEMGIQAAIVSKRGNGIRIDGDSTQRGQISDIIKERSLSMDAGLDRFYRGMLLLTCDYRHQYTTESLARAILTNKQQAPRRPTHMERAHDAVWSPDRTRPPHHRRGPRGIYPLLCRLLSI